MHHLAGVDAQGRVALCTVLAPTEWNFHPDGPLVHPLPGLRVGSGEAATRRLRCLVGLFDPCVACTLDLREGADA
jgi:coenzyme F420-reducing hydrogenase alpha subunit